MKVFAAISALQAVVVVVVVVTLAVVADRPSPWALAALGTVAVGYADRARIAWSARR